MIRLTSSWLLLAACLALAQPPPAGPVFEVASVKVNSGPLSRLLGWSASGSRLTLEGYPAVGLIMEAYHLERHQVVLPGSIPQGDDVYYNVSV